VDTPEAVCGGGGRLVDDHDDKHRKPRVMLATCWLIGCNPMESFFFKSKKM